MEAIEKRTTIGLGALGVINGNGFVLDRFDENREITESLTLSDLLPEEARRSGRETAGRFDIVVRFRPGGP